MREGAFSLCWRIAFKGWARTSLLDFPGHIATVLFTGGCNFRCPMCHNADLVLRPAELPTLPLADVWQHLDRRAGKVTSVVITGGEPTLQPDLAEFLHAVRARGYATKLDTNGYAPDALAALLEAGLLDYVAMDVKAPPANYAQVAGLETVDLPRIERSLTLLRESGVAYEFRTTIVPGLLAPDDVAALAQWIAGAERYVLQQFRGGATLDPTLSATTPYPAAELHALADRIRQWLPQVTVRGV